MLMDYRLLNLACGSKVSSYGNWTNIDFQSPIDGVIEMNILHGLSFPDATFDAVYTAQFIEHLTLAEGEQVLRNVAKVMKPGGIVRLVTPDLEELARTYLELLERIKRQADPEYVWRYDWIRVEIFDQIARDRSGGDTYEFLANCDAATQRYILDRIGYSARHFFTPSEDRQRRITFGLLLKKIDRVPRRLRKMVVDFFATETMRVGRFRRSGEVHRYMHDFYSLKSLLERSGFHSVERVDAHRSAIPNWDRYELDVVDGAVDGPLALFVEARR